ARSRLRLGGLGGLLRLLRVWLRRLRRRGRGGSLRRGLGVSHLDLRPGGKATVIGGEADVEPGDEAVVARRSADGSAALLHHERVAPVAERDPAARRGLLDAVDDER